MRSGGALSCRQVEGEVPFASPGSVEVPPCWPGLTGLLTGQAAAVAAVAVAVTEATATVVVAVAVAEPVPVAEPLAALLLARATAREAPLPEPAAPGVGLGDGRRRPGAPRAPTTRATTSAATVRGPDHRDGVPQPDHGRRHVKPSPAAGAGDGAAAAAAGTPYVAPGPRSAGRVALPPDRARPRPARRSRRHPWRGPSRASLGQRQRGGLVGRGGLCGRGTGRHGVVLVAALAHRGSPSSGGWLRAPSRPRLSRTCGASSTRLADWRRGTQEAHR